MSRIEQFFSDAGKRAQELNHDEKHAIVECFRLARELIGSTDALDHFLDWESTTQRHRRRLTKQPPDSIEDDQRFSLHLQVMTRYPSDYWLHLHVDERATFKTLWMIRSLGKEARKLGVPRQ